MLAISALTGLTLFVMTLIDDTAFGAEPGDVAPPAATPDTLWSLQEKITIGPDGDASVEVSAVLGKGGSGDLLLPFAFEDGSDFTILSGPVRFSAAAEPVRRVLGNNTWNLQTLPEAAAGDTVVVAAVARGWFDRDKARRDFGEYALSRGYVNTSRFFARDFTMTLVLPEGILVHAVTNVVPAHDPKKSPEPPYAVGRTGDRGWVSLHRKDLAPAGACRLEMRVRPARRGPVLLVVGLAAGLLYLVFFRDVLRPQKTE